MSLNDDWAKSMEHELRLDHHAEIGNTEVEMDRNEHDTL